MTQQISVNTKELMPDIKKEYICWIDIMGTSNVMRESFERATNFILRFHCFVNEAIAALTNPRDNQEVKLYPLMDGVYIVTPELDLLTKIIFHVYDSLTSYFVNTQENKHRFMVRGSIAYGDLAHGRDINAKVCTVLHPNTDYKGKLLFGLPMIQAYNSESQASPMGLYIHESARSIPKYTPNTQDSIKRIESLQGRFFYWWKVQKPSTYPSRIIEEAGKYFDWCSENIFRLKMDTEKIKRYRAQLTEYFHG